MKNKTRENKNEQHDFQIRYECLVSSIRSSCSAQCNHFDFATVNNKTLGALYKITKFPTLLRSPFRTHFIYPRSKYFHEHLILTNACKFRSPFGRADVSQVIIMLPRLI